MVAKKAIAIYERHGYIHGATWIGFFVIAPLAQMLW